MAIEPSRRLVLDEIVARFAAELAPHVRVEGGLIDPESDGYHVLTELSRHVLPRPATYHAPFHRMGMCAKAFVVAPSGRILVGRRSARMAGAGLWDMPAGNYEPGEDFAATARREAFEETGLRLRLAEPPFHLAVHVLDYGFERRRHHMEACFLEEIGSEVVVAPGAEMSEWRWASEDDLLGDPPRFPMFVPEVNRPAAAAAFAEIRRRKAR